MGATAETLLQAWERGAALAPFERAASLLTALADEPEDVPVHELTVGQCDARLLALRRAVFGEELELVATCPECQAQVELTVSLGDVQPPIVRGPPEPLTVRVDGVTLVCRVPVNADLVALAAQARPPQTLDLVERCTLEVRGRDGAALATRDLPVQTLDAVLAELAEHDPGADISLRVHCPCGSDWPQQLDIRPFIWNDLTDWVGRTLSEVHQLAQVYGWSEADILAMPQWRRGWYLEAIQA